jgi:molybdopterin-guanine dinucleotide biosynthesis protein A
LIDALEERLKGRENLSLRAFFGNYAKIEVELSNPLALENANTPEDWRAILKQVTRQSLQ